MINDLRKVRAILETLCRLRKEGKAAAALRAADLYTGSAIAELRSTFEKYIKT